MACRPVVLSPRQFKGPAFLTAALGIAIVTALLSARGSQVPRPTAIEALKLGFSEEKKTELVAGWNSALLSGDVSLVTSAVGLLEFAPPTIRTTILTEAKNSTALPTLFKSLDREKRDLLVRSVSPYPELIAPIADPLTQELTALPLVRENLQYISDVVIALNHQPALSADLCRKLLTKEPSIQDPQIRTAVASLFLAHPSSLKSLENEVRSLAQSKNHDDRRVSLQLLMALDAKISAAELEEALNQPEGLQLDAIKYIGRRPESLSTEELQVLIPVFAKPLSAATWEATYNTLRKKNPELLSEFFSKYKQQFGDWSKLPARTLVRMVDLLPSEQSADLASWPLIKSDADDCDILVTNLLLLKRRAAIKIDFANGLWTTLESKQGCPDPNDPNVAALVDQILGARSGVVDELAQYLSNQTQNPDWDNFISGIAFQTVANFRRTGSESTRLQQALSPALVKFLAARQDEKVLELLRIGVPYQSVTKMVNSNAFVAEYKNPSKLRKQYVLEMLGRLHDLPSPLWNEILAVAKDTTQPTEVRQAAINALSNADNAKSYFNDFAQIAQEPINLPSSAALNSLEQLYAAQAQSIPMLSPTAPWLANAAADQLTRDDASKLFTLLAARDRAFGPLLLRSIEDVTSYRCWDLAVMNTVQPRIWLTILDVGLTNSDRLNPARACVMVLTANQPAATLISSALTGQRSQNTPQTASDRSALLAALGTVWNETSGLNGARAAIANQVDLLSSSVPYDVTSQRQLRAWADRLKPEFPEAASRIRSESTKQTIILFILGLPIAVLFHSLFWVAVLLLYPHSPAVQSIFFWNPIVRKILALGYMDILLLAIPFVRMVLFAPLREQMLGEVLQPNEAELDRLAYFTKGRIRRMVTALGEPDALTEEPIFNALSKLRRRTLLLGASGLGKSSFLRYSLYQKSSQKEYAIYLPAARCAGGVEKAITARVQLFSQDTDLLHSLIYAGRLEVYIDGYNEVNPETQEEIASFTAAFSKARILITSQIPIRGVSRIETLELLPLRRDEIREFLTSREPILPHACAIRGEDYRGLANLYLEDLWKNLQTDSETKAIEQILSNPMDLTTAAIVLGNGKEPSLFALQEQQFEMLQQRHLKRYEAPFRTYPFSEDIFKNRVANEDDLSKSAFEREVASLIDDKMAIVRAIDVPGKPARQEIFFRHDRIRDYFTHFAFLEPSQDERRLQYANDSRFAGVYEYLAKVLDLGLAERLKEQLLMSAVESQDHRLSDSFIRQLSWRQQFASSDPAWLVEYDLKTARNADLEFDGLQMERANLEQRMLNLKDIMSSSRDVTRILTTYDDAKLASLGLRCLQALGGTISVLQKSTPVFEHSITSPSGLQFTLAALGSRVAIDAFQIELITQRLKDAPRPVLLITNSNVSLNPTDRPSDLTTEAFSKFLNNGIMSSSASEVYSVYKEAIPASRTTFWTERESLWQRISNGVPA